MLYGTFRGALPPVPAGRGATAASMARFAAARGASSEAQPVSVAHAAGRWRRAGCAAGEADAEPMRGGGCGACRDGLSLTVDHRP